MTNFKWYRRLLGGTWYKHDYVGINYDSVLWNRKALGSSDVEVYPKYESVICWFSRNFFDVHDYHRSKGGDGIPSHFYEYTCNMCSKKFTI